MIKTTVRRRGMKLLAIFMCVAIAITFMPGVGLLYADESHGAVIKQGTLEGPDGAEVPWVLDDENTVTIGDGSDNQTIVDPILSGGVFGNEKDNVKKIKFSGNVNIIGSASFSFLPKLEEFDASGLRLGDPVGNLSKASFPYFWDCNSLKSVDLRGTGLFENWENEVEGEGQSFFNGCESLETLRFDFDEENCNGALKNLSASFLNCPNLRSADVARLVAHGVEHDCVDLRGGYDGSGEFGPFGSNTMNVAYGILDEYAPFYAENHTDMYNAVTNFNRALNNICSTEGNNKSEVISTYDAVENIVKNSITIDEYEELQRIRSEAAAVLAQDPFPHSQDVKELLETIVEKIDALGENSTKQDAQGIIDDYNQYNRLVADSFKAMLNALPSEDDVKLTHEDDITTVRTKYEGLTDAQKALVGTDELQKLVDAETGLNELKTLLNGLQNLVSEAKGLNTDPYSEASVDTLTQAINAAETLLGGDPTKGEVDAARLALEDAIKNLKTKETQDLEDAKAELGALIENARTLDSNLLTDESKASLESAIGDAQLVYDNPNATKDDLDAAIETLTQAMGGLKDLADYREGAEKELREYKNHDDYSEAGKTSLNEIVNAAVAEINTKTSEADIDAVVTKAKADMDAVKTKAEEEFDQAKEDLDKAIKDAEDKLKDKDKYTDDSVKALEDAIDVAKEKLADPNATKEDIDNAKKAVDDAVAGLKEKGSENDPNAPIPSEITPQTPATQASVEKMITTAKNDNDLKGSTFAPLKFMSNKQTKKSIKVKWTKVKGAKKYTLYGNLCGKNKPYKKIASVSGSTVNVNKVAGKKLKKGKMYKFVVVAEKDNQTIALSKTIHVSSGGKKKVGNYNKVNVKKKVVKKAKKLKVGKTLALKAKATKKKGKKVKRHVKVRYESSNKTIATVTKAGKVKGIKKGKCVIYAYAQNGIYKKVSVTVK